MDSPSKDLKPVPVMLNDVLLAGIDKACADVGQSRAHFIRIAIAKELEAMGITIDKSAIHPPSRAGKGGRPTHKKTTPPRTSSPKIIHRGEAARVANLSPEEHAALWPETRRRIAAEEKVRRSAKKSPPSAKEGGAAVESKPVKIGRKTA